MSEIVYSKIDIPCADLKFLNIFASVVALLIVLFMKGQIKRDAHLVNEPAFTHIPIRTSRKLPV